MHGCMDVLFPPSSLTILCSLLVSVVVIVRVTNDTEKAPAIVFSDSWHEIGSTREGGMFFVLVKERCYGET